MEHHRKLALVSHPWSVCKTGIPVGCPGIQDSLTDVLRWEIPRAPGEGSQVPRAGWGTLEITTQGFA